MKKIALCLLAFTMFLFVGFAYAPTRTLSVEGKQKISIPLELKENDRFSGKILVSGNLDIDFYVVDPNGNVFLSYIKVGNLEFAFSAPRDGQYTFYFDNTESDQQKDVTFNYNIQHYIFGVPQELFLLGVIVVIIMICLVVFAASSKM